MVDEEKTPKLAVDIMNSKCVALLCPFASFVACSMKIVAREPVYATGLFGRLFRGLISQSTVAAFDRQNDEANQVRQADRI